MGIESIASRAILQSTRTVQTGMAEQVGRTVEQNVLPTMDRDALQLTVKAGSPGVNRAAAALTRGAEALEQAIKDGTLVDRGALKAAKADLREALSLATTTRDALAIRNAAIVPYLGLMDRQANYVSMSQNMYHNRNYHGTPIDTELLNRIKPTETRIHVSDIIAEADVLADQLRKTPLDDRLVHAAATADVESIPPTFGQLLDKLKIVQVADRTEKAVQWG